MTTTEPQATTPPEVMDEVMTRHFIAEDAHDRPGILATLTPDAEHDAVGFPGAPFHGHDDLMAFYEALFDQLEQTGVEPIRRLHGPNFLVDEILYKGRARNGFMGFDVTDPTPVEFRLLHVCEFEDDRISREQVWLDVNALRVQLGELG